MRRALCLHGWHRPMQSKRSLHPFPQLTRSTKRSTSHCFCRMALATWRRHNEVPAEGFRLVPFRRKRVWQAESGHTVSTGYQATGYDTWTSRTLRLIFAASLLTPRDRPRSLAALLLQRHLPHSHDPATGRLGAASPVSHAARAVRCLLPRARRRRCRGVGRACHRPGPGNWTRSPRRGPKDLGVAEERPLLVPAHARARLFSLLGPGSGADLDGLVHDFIQLARIFADLAGRWPSGPCGGPVRSVAARASECLERRSLASGDAVPHVAGEDLGGRSAEVEPDGPVDDLVPDGDHEAGDVPNEEGAGVRPRVAVP
jgi:hypothetical protein